jgi:hypothetical protein
VRIETYKPYMQGLPHDNEKLTGSDWEKQLAEDGGGYNPSTKTFTPFDFPDGLDSGADVFDALTAACEAGVLDVETWATTCFANKQSLGAFLETLASYNEEFRVMDRWALAFMRLGDSEYYEGSYTTSEQMAESLHKHLVETGQYESFDKPKAAKKATKSKKVAA